MYSTCIPDDEEIVSVALVSPRVEGSYVTSTDVTVTDLSTWKSGLSIYWTENKHTSCNRVIK